MKVIYNSMKYLKIVIVFISILLSGILYSCNVKDSVKGNVTMDLQKTTESLSKGVSNDTNNAKNLQDNTKVNAKLESVKKLFVYVCGCVISPGVYEVDSEMRIYNIITLAGGFSQEADTDYLNLAECATDGQKIYVPAKGETPVQESVQNAAQNSLININKATKEQLMTLPGIGESRALDIIQYRTNSGVFHSIEEIKNVSGIKDAAFNKIKDKITV